MVGAEHLYFYDAISPIVLAESLDMGKVFRASRWGRSLRRHERTGGSEDPPLPAMAGLQARLKLPAASTMARATT